MEDFRAHIPTYTEVCEALRIFPGTPLADITSLNKQLGTLKHSPDLSEPDKWISERLHGRDQELAQRIWDDSHHNINPYYFYQLYRSICIDHDLLDVDSNGILRLTERGERFLANNPVLIREIDERLGLIQLLLILTTKGDAQQADMLPEWTEYVTNASKYRKRPAPDTIETMLSFRLRNLVKRKLVDRDESTRPYTHAITTAGREYIDGAAPASNSCNDAI